MLFSLSKNGRIKRVSLIQIVYNLLLTIFTLLIVMFFLTNYTYWMLYRNDKGLKEWFPNVKEFVQKSFAYVGLDYKKYLVIDKKLFRPSKTVSLSGDTKKAQKILKYKVNTKLDKLISIMMENDLKIEKNSI